MAADPDPKPRIPKPPSKEELDQVSRDQALITDEWVPQPPPQRPGDRAPPEKG